MSMAFPRHDYFYHGIFTDCSVCKHPAQCTRLTALTGSEHVDVCRACIAERDAPEGLVVEQWCSECWQSIPDEMYAESISEQTCPSVDEDFASTPHPRAYYDDRELRPPE